MRVASITPVGPGHEKVYKDAIRSVAAMVRPVGWTVEAMHVIDTAGRMGRCRAKNVLCSQADAQWLLFVDADDVVEKDALLLLERELRSEPGLGAVWGPFFHEYALLDSQKKVIETRVSRSDSTRTPIETWDALIDAGPFGGSRIAFVRRDLFLRLGGWYEAWMIGEDIELSFACAAHAPFRKIDECIVRSRMWIPSAEGPRGYKRSDLSSLTREAWDSRGSVIHDYWAKRDREPWTVEEVSARRAGLLYSHIGSLPGERIPLGEGSE